MMTTLVFDKVLAIIQAQMNQIYNCKLPPISGDKRLADLELDSLDRIEVIMAVEDEFHCVIDDDDAERLSTINDIVSLVYRLKPHLQPTSEPERITFDEWVRDHWPKELIEQQYNKGLFKQCWDMALTRGKA